MPLISKGVKTIIIKFGGSIITHKSVPYSFNADVTKQLALQLKDGGDEYVLVHGAGSYGHPLAQKFHLEKGLGGTQKQEKLHGVCRTHTAVRTLNNEVMKVLHEVNIPAVSVSPFPFYDNDFDWRIIRKILHFGFTPVTYGDVVMSQGNIAICSGDLLMKEIALELGPERAIFVTDVDGIYLNPDDTTAVLGETSIEEIEQAHVTGSTHTDVTEGMAGKLREIKAMVDGGVEVDIINGKKEGRLLEAIKGNVKGTKIRG